MELDTRNNCPDNFSAKIHEKMKTSEVVAINKGISADRITEKGIKKYAHDILNIKGVKYIVVFYGINDLCALERNSSQIISAYKSTINQAHKKKYIYIYCGIILTFSDYNRKHIWNKKKEKVINEVNK